MNPPQDLAPADLDQLTELGIREEEAWRQIDLLREPPARIDLIAPCTLDDGIIRLPGNQQDSCLRTWASLVGSHQIAKFVPASGAATRMFRDLSPPLDPRVSDQLRQGLGPQPPNFAFRHQLVEQLGTDDFEAESALPELLEERGLGYRSLPKGLIPFHLYRQGTRTASVEHLWEGIHYLAAPSGTSCFHFTVGEAHQSAFEEHLASASEELSRREGARVELTFSNQSRSTDTLAIDAEGRPVRRPDGTLLLRPAGHGALLGNLESVDAEIAIIKNIDNIAHQRLHSISIHWKRVLAGYFAELQQEIFQWLDRLEGRPESGEVIEECVEWMISRLALRPGPAVLAADHESRRRQIQRLLDRPLRVCGVVENVGEPGGGPFWVRGADGEISGQVVEGAQVDSSSSEQMEIWKSSSHFNPVDLVCGLRDRSGRPYRLADFVDPAAAIVTQKTYRDQPVTALERPGLWNGSMALWNTVFVEVPLETFTPVKTVFDLLRPEHQPASQPS